MASKDLGIVLFRATTFQSPRFTDFSLIFLVGQAKMRKQIRDD